MKRIVLRHSGARAEGGGALRESGCGRADVASGGQRTHGVQRGRVIWIGGKIIVPEVFISAEQQPEVVPFIFFDAQAGHVVGVSAISEAAQTEGVEEETMVVERAHLEVKIEEANSGTEILKRVVGVLVASDFVQAITEFDGRMNIVIAGINSFRFFGIVLGASGRRKAERHNKDGGRNRPNPQASFHGFSLPLRTSNSWLIVCLACLPSPSLKMAFRRVLLKEGRIEVGAVNLRMTQHTRLEKTRLVVKRRSSWRPAKAGRGVALQAQQVHIAQLQHVRIGSAVHQMAGLAPIDLYRLVFEYKRSLFVRVALEADRILCGGGSHLLGPHCAVGIVADSTLDEDFVHSMMEGHVAFSLLRAMARIANLGLRLQQQEIGVFAVVRRMAGNATDLVPRVLGVDRIHVLRAARMAGHATVVDFLCRRILEGEYLGDVTAACNVS